MKDPIVKLIIDSIPAMSLSLFGGFVSLFGGKKRKTTVMFVVGVFSTSAFVGLVLNMILTNAGISDHMRAVTIAIGGTMAKTVLDALRKKIFPAIDGDKE